MPATKKQPSSGNSRARTNAKAFRKGSTRAGVKAAQGEVTRLGGHGRKPAGGKGRPSRASWAKAKPTFAILATSARGAYAGPHDLSTREGFGP